ncbi:hypothetical protein C5167_037660, partial [Papaver somniferum]
MVSNGHQSLDPPAVHGVTQFSDLTPTEFRKSVLGLRSLKLPTDAQQDPILPTNDLPTDFDWRDHGAVTDVKNQVLVGLAVHSVQLEHQKELIFLLKGNLLALVSNNLLIVIM